LIASNPFLGANWIPLAKALAFSMKSSTSRNPFQFQTYGRKYGLMPMDSPYFQGYCDEISQEWIVEASGNLQCRPPLTDLQYQELEFYGWKAPTQTPDEFAVDGYIPDIEVGSPNFVRIFPKEENLNYVVEAILTAAVGVYGIGEDDFFNFGEGGIADKVGNLQLLGRVKASQGNERREIFAMPGKHLKAIGE
jgi:hypothetical protein